MATRKKHIRTPYEDERKKHRAAASRHVLALEAQIKEDDKRKLFHIANDLRVYGNHRFFTVVQGIFMHNFIQSLAKITSM